AIHGAQHPRPPSPPGPARTSFAPATEEERKNKSKAASRVIAGLVPLLLLLLLLLLFSFLRGWHTRRVSGVGWEGGVGALSAMGRTHASDGLGRSPTPVLPCAQDSAHEQARNEARRSGFCRPPHTPPTRPTHTIQYARQIG